MGVTRPPLEYLATCSKAALESFELSRLSRASNLRKELSQILEGWIESEVDARLARWLLESKRSHRDGTAPAVTGAANPSAVRQMPFSFLPPSAGGVETAGSGRDSVPTKIDGSEFRREGAFATQPFFTESVEEVARDSSLQHPHAAEDVADESTGAGDVEPAAACVAFAEDEGKALRELERFLQPGKPLSSIRIALGVTAVCEMRMAAAR